MTVEFALFLSPEGIALAHRQPARHWALIGETGLEGDDFGRRLGRLRQRGEARGGPDFPTLLILPDDQILYTELAVMDGPGTDLAIEVGRALDGRTPYALGELAFDYRHIAPGRAQVAAVAQETLTEALDFARAAGFNGVGFAASPPASKFSGVPVFEMAPGFRPPTLPGVGLEFGPDDWTGVAEESADYSPEPPHVFVTEAPKPAPEPEPEVAPEPEPERLVEAVPEPEVLAEPPEPAAEAEPSLEETPAPAPEALPSASDPEAPEAEAPELPAAAGPAETETETPPAPVADATDTPVPTEAAEPDAALDAPTEPDPSGPEPTVEATVAEDEPAEDDADPVAEEAEAAPSADIPAPAPPLNRAPAIESSDHEAATFAVDQPAAEGPEETPAAEPILRFGAHRRVPAAPGAVGRIVRNRRARLGLVAPPRDEIPPAPPPDPEPVAEDPPADPTPATETPPRRRVPRLPAVLAGRGRAAAEDAPPETAPPAEDDLPPGLPPGIAARLRRNRGLPPLEDTAEPETGPPAAAVAFTALDADQAARPGRRTSGLRAERDEPIFGPLDSDDGLITGGLLARRTADATRPSLRTALVLTLVMVLLLALIAVWSALFLPESRVARLLGRVAPELDAIVSAPDAGISAPSEASAEIAALPSPEDAAPEAEPAPETGIDAEAEADALLPEDLPGIDDDLPEPAPQIADVAPPRPAPTLAEVEAEYAETGIWQLAPEAPATPGNEFLVPEVHDDVSLAALDPVVVSLDAVALPVPAAPRALRGGVPVAPPFGRSLPLELVEPTPEGVMSPAGAFVRLGRPSVDAIPRPGPDPEPDGDGAAVEGEEEPEPAGDETSRELIAATIDEAILATFEPTPRPDDLTERRERQVLGGLTLSELQERRPTERPQSLQEVALAAQAAQSAVANAPEGSPLAVAVSVLPRTRPESVVAAAAQAGTASVEPAAAASLAATGGDFEPETPATVTPDIPSNGTVSRSATMDNVINLREVNLIGVSGAPTDRRALVRLPSGRFVTVAVGDRIDGGRVAAIGPNTLQYIKNGRNITLEMPSG